MDWEESGEVRILDDKQIPARVPFKKGDAENCLDLIMITKGLEDRTKNYKLDVNREWTPARAVSTGKGVGPGTVYIRGKANDHKAQKVTVMNYNNRKGWLLYTVLSNK